MLWDVQCKDTRPAIVVGAGYGLEKAFYELLTEGHSQPCLVFTDKALPKCPKKLAPDFAVSLNTEETADVRLRDWYSGVNGKTRLVLPITAHPSHVRTWVDCGGGEILWVVPHNIDDDLATDWSLKYESPSIPRGANAGEFAWMVANLRGCNPIGLIGMPYAWKSLPEVLAGQTPEYYEYHEFCSDGKRCYTTLPFMVQRNEFIEMVHHFGMGKTFNLSEGGILYDRNVIERTSLEAFIGAYLHD